MNETTITEGMTVRLTEPVLGHHSGMQGREGVIVPAGTEAEVGCEDDIPGTWILTAEVELSEMLVDVEMWAVRPIQFEPIQE